MRVRIGDISMRMCKRMTYRMFVVVVEGREWYNKNGLWDIIIHHGKVL